MGSEEGNAGVVKRNSMKAIFDGDRPDTERLTHLFGLCPPSLFVRFLQSVFDRHPYDTAKARDLYWRLTDLYDKPCMLYDSTPLELFAIGGSGGDGHHTGFAVLAPERNVDDVPWFSYIPAGHELEVLANDTPAFLRQLLSVRLVSRPEFAPEIRSVADDLAIEVSEEFGRTLGFQGGSRREKTGETRSMYLPAIPAGWQFEPVEGHVGVLAPASAFEAGPFETQGDLMKDVGRHLKTGHPASALSLLCSPRGTFGSGPAFRNWARDLKRAYLDLGRPIFADRWDEHISSRKAQIKK